jgi:tetratricopeptide (TPR) repeat protein
VGRVGQARRQAGERWEYLRALPAWARRVLVEGAREYQSWSLCEHLCAESERAAADDAARALELASLALRVAELVPGPEAWRSRLQGYAWAHLGNARRVAGDLSAADEAFKHARRFREAGAPGDPKVLSEGRLLDLEASLRREQRRWEEAVSLHDRALAKAPAADHGSILLNKAFTLQQKGDFERAIETLLTVGPLIDGSREPRLSCVLRFNLAANLSQLGRHEEAEELLPEVRRLAMGLGNGLDLVRLRWLEGRCAAGLGRTEEALVALSQVREDFTSRGIAYDAALATLELAVLYLEQGRTGEVRRLARQMTPIFKAQGVHREALAVLKLFCEAADKDAASVAMVRRVVEYLHRARHNPELHFEE